MNLSFIETLKRDKYQQKSGFFLLFAETEIRIMFWIVVYSFHFKGRDNKKSKPLSLLSGLQQ